MSQFYIFTQILQGNLLSRLPPALIIWLTVCIQWKFYFELWSVSCDGADFSSHYFSPKKCNACLKFCTLSAQLHPIFTWVTFFYSGSPTHLLFKHSTCQSGNMTSLFLQRFVVTAPSLMPLFDPDCVGRPSAVSLELHVTRNSGQDIQTLHQGVRRSK